MENKEKYAFWLYPKTKKLVESHIKDTACRSQSEFVEDAIRFYCGHLDVNTGEAIGYLAPVLNGMIKAEIAGTEQRLARLLFKVAEVGSKNQDRHLYFKFAFAGMRCLYQKRKS